MGQRPIGTLLIGRRRQFVLKLLELYRFIGQLAAGGVQLRGLLATALLLIQAAGSSGFQAFYSLVVNLATMTAVVPYAFCALAGGLIAARAAGGGPVPKLRAIEWIAFVFSLFTLYGCGPSPVLYGFMLLMLGIPVYVWQVRQRSSAA